MHTVRWLLLVLCGVVLISITIVALYFLVEKPTTSPTATPIAHVERQPKRYFLTLIVIAKNESMVIEEFLQHYRQQGVNHVYLINNGSTDNMLNIVKPFEALNFVTVYNMDKPNSQTEHYNTVYAERRFESEWMAVVDVDEYLYGVKKPLVRWLWEDCTEQDQYFYCYQINFGSNGHITQPHSIRRGFTKRYKDHLINRETIVAGKALFRTDCVVSMGVHHQVTNTPLVICQNKFVSDTELRMNHYVIMSWEYFETVKMTRGDAFYPTNTRDQNYFKQYDEPAVVVDEVLSNIVRYGY